MTTYADTRAAWFLDLLASLGHPMHQSGSTILDFGCGLGGNVQALVDRGFDAFGCDFNFELGESSDRIRPIEEPYRIPFDDNTFDGVISDQVFEHVQDYQLALREVRRVLRPSGVSIHVFPARYLLREPHTFVPLATIVRSRPWLLLWAMLGVRNQFQQEKTALEVVALNRRYLREHTTYYARARVLSEARSVFPQSRLVDSELLASRPGRRARALSRLARHAPILAVGFCETRARALFTPPR